MSYTTYPLFNIPYINSYNIAEYWVCVLAILLSLKDNMPICLLNCILMIICSIASSALVSWEYDLLLAQRDPYDNMFFPCLILSYWLKRDHIEPNKMFFFMWPSKNNREGVQGQWNQGLFYGPLLSMQW